MKKNYLFLSLIIAFSLKGISQECVLTIKKAHVFKIDSIYSPINSYGARSYSRHWDFLHRKEMKSGNRVIEFFLQKGKNSYRLEYNFKAGKSYEIKKSKNGPVLISKKPKTVISDAEFKKVNIEKNKEKIIKLFENDLPESNICKFTFDYESIPDVKIYLYKIDDYYGPYGWWLSRYNNGWDGDINVELLPGRHTFEMDIYYIIRVYYDEQKFREYIDEMSEKSLAYIIKNQCGPEKAKEMINMDDAILDLESQISPEKYVVLENADGYKKVQMLKIKTIEYNFEAGKTYTFKTTRNDTYNSLEIIEK